VFFTQEFHEAIVVAGPPSYNGGDASTIRMTDVSNTGFKIRIQEFNYQGNKQHTQESVSWLAVEAGEWIVADDTRISAGSTWVEAGGKDSLTDVEYSTFFSGGAPATVLASVSSDNGDQTLVTRVEDSDATGFAVWL
jgi:hypothetical protein